jgi:hypothetical protein
MWAVGVVRALAPPHHADLLIPLDMSMAVVTVPVCEGLGTSGAADGTNHVTASSIVAAVAAIVAGALV